MGSAGPPHTIVFVDMKFDTANCKMSTENDLEVDVILQKTSTLPPEAFQALLQWCEVTSALRSEKELPPVVVIDPPQIAQVVLRRSLLVSVLHSGMPASLCLTPRSWVCHCPAGVPELIEGGDKEGTEKRVEDGNGSEAWWIAKTDLSTGLPYTHRMVVWYGPFPRGGVPLAVRRLLPSEASTFVMQEFLVHAIPFVLKVYCVGGHMSIRAVPVASLAYVGCRELYSPHGEGLSREPIAVDSQKMFSHKGEWERQHPQLANFWRSYLAEGSQFHSRCLHIASQLSQVLQLSLFGFDLLLLPAEPDWKGWSKPNCPMTPEAVGKLLFDEENEGVPTAVLRNVFPVVVDVNYFPGYGGMPNVEQYMLELIESRVNGAGSSA
uniref:Uncharacterized protein n=1 Tax=Trypanosoma congolense (strain IL3000) TaxID=1068625 RepID=G0USM4_TRYCI|nr:conserved hypothetical protein [Trypanosoma congolense IL3000]